MDGPLKNRLHLDVNPTDREQDEEVRRLLDLGARHADVGQGDESWVALADPEGTAAPYRRPHTAPDLLPVAYPRSPIIARSAVAEKCRRMCLLHRAKTCHPGAKYQLVLNAQEMI